MLKLLQKVLPVSFLLGLGIFLVNGRELNQKMINTVLFLSLSFLLFEYLYGDKKNDIKEGLWIPFMGEIGKNKKMEEFEDEEEDGEILNTEESKEDDCMCKPGDKKQKGVEVDEDDLELTPKDDDVPVIGKGKQSMGPIGVEKSSKKLLDDLSKGGININLYINKNGEISTGEESLPEKSQKSKNNQGILKDHEDCIKLQQAGFNPSWNKKVVEDLMNTESGKKILMGIDERFKALTGKEKLEDEDIVKCFPNYLGKVSNMNKNGLKMKNLGLSDMEQEVMDDLASYNDYSSTLNMSRDNEKESSNILRGLGSRNATERPTSNIFLINNSKESKEETTIESTAEELEDTFQSGNKIEKSKEPSTCNKKEIVRETVCNLKDMRFEISKEIERYYLSVVNSMVSNCSLPTGYTKNDVWSGYRKNFSYIADRCMLEIGKVIRNWKGKTYTQWRKHLETLKVRFHRGLPISGTDFFVPWYIIEKHEVCMGDKANNYGGYPLEMEGKNYAY